MRVAYNMSPREWAEAYCNIRPHEEPKPIEINPNPHASTGYFMKMYDKVYPKIDPNAPVKSFHVTSVGGQLGKDKVTHIPLCHCKDQGYMGPTKAGVRMYKAQYQNGLSYCGCCQGLLAGQDISAEQLGQLGKGRPTFDPTYIKEDNT